MSFRIATARLALVLAVSLVAAAAAVPTTQAVAAPRRSAPVVTRHYIANIDGHFRAVAGLGYNVLDAGPSDLPRLPRGTRALIWVGQDTPTPPGRGFKALVNRLANNRKVFGYFLSDEPALAPGAAAALRARADYIAAASGGRQLSFVVLDGQRKYRAYRPAVTHVDLVGIDPYACSIAHPRCDPAEIPSAVRGALRAGIPRRKLVPTYQAFGQEHLSAADHYYNMPSRSQERRLLLQWHRLLPHPVLDYTYGWEHQASANPTLVDRPRLQSLFNAYFTR
jgi:hypothetical protein